LKQAFPQALKGFGWLRVVHGETGQSDTRAAARLYRQFREAPARRAKRVRIDVPVFRRRGWARCC